MSASDDAAIDAHTTLYASVSPTNDAGAGILNKLAGALLDDYQFTSHSGTRLVHFGDKVRTDDGTVYQYMGEDATLDLDEAAQDYSDYGYWKPLSRAEPDHRLARVRGAVGARHGAEEGRPDRQRRQLLRPDRPQRPAQRGAGVHHRHAGHRGRQRDRVGASRRRRCSRSTTASCRRGRASARSSSRTSCSRARRRGSRRRRSTRRRRRRVGATNTSTLDGDGDVEDRGLRQDASAPSSPSTRSAGSRRTSCSTRSTRCSATR